MISKDVGKAVESAHQAVSLATQEPQLEGYCSGGDIIVTTDQFGLIRVFRQDCAYAYRRMFIDFYRKGQIKTVMIFN